MNEYEGDLSYDPFDEVVEEGDFVDEAEPSEESEEIEAGAEEQAEDEESTEQEEIGEENEPSESGPEDGDDEPEVEAKDGEEEAKESEVEDEEKREPEELLAEVNQKLENGELEIQIDEETSVTLKDLKNDYIGQKEISKRFTEIDQRNKQLEQDSQEINTYVNEFAEIMRNGDAVGAMQYLGQFAGVAPFMIKEQLVAALKPEIIRRDQMSPTEIQNEYLNSQNEYLVEQRGIEDKRKETEQANTELQNQVNEIREANEIDEDTWNQTKNEIEQSLEEGEELTPELVAQTVQYNRMYDQAESVINSLEDKLENQEEWIEKLVDVKEMYPNFTDEDLKEVAVSALAELKKNSIEKKLEEKLSSKPKPQPKTSVEEDEIDPELEDWL